MKCLRRVKRITRKDKTKKDDGRKEVAIDSISEMIERMQFK